MFVALVACGCSSSSVDPIPDSALADSVSVDADVAAETLSDTASDRLEPTLTQCVADGPVRWLALGEASGAAALDDAASRLVVVSDSGGDGGAVIIELSTWDVTPITLPLDDAAGDDVEGLSRSPRGTIAGLTSAGYLREWTVDGNITERVADAYAISDDPAFTCAATSTNCGPNYEGICLHPAPSVGSCVGYAAAKGRGELVCLTRAADRYRVDPDRPIRIEPTPPSSAEAGIISGCAFEPAPPYRLIVGGNIFSHHAIWEVTGYDRAAGATVTKLGIEGPLNQEAVVFGANGPVSFGDTQMSDRSPAITFRCDVNIEE